jgi:hypothetical protein
LCRKNTNRSIEASRLAHRAAPASRSGAIFFALSVTTLRFAGFPAFRLSGFPAFAALPRLGVFPAFRAFDRPVFLPLAPFAEAAVRPAAPAYQRASFAAIQGPDRLRRCLPVVDLVTEIGRNKVTSL